MGCPLFTMPREPVVIHGPDFTGRFSSYSYLPIWDNMEVDKWFKQPGSMTSGPNQPGPAASGDPLEFQESVPHSEKSLAPSHSPATAHSQENPNPDHCSPPPLAEHSLAGEPTPEASSMAFLNIDPNPMMLPGFSRMMVQGREPFIRMVTPRATPRNEDLAIVTVTPLPTVEVPFGEIRDVILGLLVEDYDLQVRDIQMCPFGRGQAFVRFARLSDRDGLIAHSPHHHHGFTLNFVQHNRGDNDRRVNFNRECWLMLIGYPPDYRSNEEIGHTIKSFGRLLFWQRDNVLARIIIKARVTDLVDIPHYIIISEGDFFEGVSLTVQCEIL
jgi:hypothetical protein